VRYSISLTSINSPRHPIAMPIFLRRTIVLNTHQASIVSPLSGTDNMARVVASAVAEIPSILEVSFWRCGFANIRQSLLSLVERHEAFQRRIGWPPCRSFPEATSSRIFFDGSDNVGNPGGFPRTHSLRQLAELRVAGSYRDRSRFPADQTSVRPTLSVLLPPGNQ
jgi:hypothetical protein